jgi:hypothetical protein
LVLRTSALVTIAVDLESAMSASARAKCSSIAALVLVAALQMNCTGEDAELRPFARAGWTETELDDEGDGDSDDEGDGDSDDEGDGESDDQGGGPGGGGSGGADSLDDLDWSDPDAAQILEGECGEENELHACLVYNAYGCVAGAQRCVDGEWSTCNFGNAI